MKLLQCDFLLQQLCTW